MRSITTAKQGHGLPVISIVVLVALAAGCAGAKPAMDEMPLTAGTPRTFRADFERVEAATRGALAEADISLESSRHVEPELLVLRGVERGSVFGGGADIRIVVEGAGPSMTIVRTLVERSVRRRGDSDAALTRTLHTRIQRRLSSW